MIAEDSLVVPHCHQLWPGDRICAGIDVVILDEHGKIFEHLVIVPHDRARPTTGLSHSPRHTSRHSGRRLQAVVVMDRMAE